MTKKKLVFTFVVDEEKHSQSEELFLNAAIFRLMALVGAFETVSDLHMEYEDDK